MPKSSRILTALAALLLLALYALPVWRISLTAPQYPEGLGMYIRIDTIVGASEFDLSKINSLNKYIGMRPIEAAAIPELRYMPWIVAALVAGGLAAAALGRRRALYAWLVGFALLGAAGLADFYRWSYDYGHNLDAETAIITVPGMSYQPPLFGTKQLLNFTATSWPAAGGWLAGLSFALGALAATLALRADRRARTGLAAATLVAAAACGGNPRPLTFDGTETCDYCRMAITDPRFGGALVTSTGKTHEFDSVECLASFYAAAAAGTVASAWVSDFRKPGTLVPAEQARFVRKRGSRGSPMGLGLLAFSPDADAAALRTDSGDPMRWADVVALVQREGLRAGGEATAVGAHDEPEHAGVADGRGR